MTNKTPIKNKAPVNGEMSLKNKAPAKSKKQLFIIIAIIIFLLLTLGGVFFYLKLKGKTFEITFDTDGGVAVEKITVKANTEVELPKTSKTGFDFVGWILDEEILPTRIIPEGNLNLKAIWRKEAKVANSSGENTTPVTESTNAEQPNQLQQPEQPNQPNQQSQSEQPSQEQSSEQQNQPEQNGQQWSPQIPNLHVNQSLKKLSCPQGYVLNGTWCYRTVTTYKTCNCPVGYALVSGSGASKVCQKFANHRPSCKDVTYSTDPRNNAWCLKENACFLKRTPNCKGSWNIWRFNGECYEYKVYVSESDVTSYLTFCDEGHFVDEVGKCVIKVQPTCTCPAGYTEQSKICKKTIVIPATIN